MRKGIYWAVRIVALVLAIKVALWGWQEYQTADSGPQPREVLDVDKVCSIIADTGQCFCHDRQTNQRLSVPYSECKARAGHP
jgi:hypothetical protein